MQRNVEVDSLESKSWDEQQMRERFRWLRENDPAFWSEKDQLWVITKYEHTVFGSGPARVLYPLALLAGALLTLRRRHRQS